MRYLHRLLGEFYYLLIYPLYMLRDFLDFVDSFLWILPPNWDEWFINPMGDWIGARGHYHIDRYTQYVWRGKW